MVTTKPSRTAYPPHPSAPAAFDALFHEQWGRVYGVLYRLVGVPQEAEELALEVFWRLYRQPPAAQEPDELAGWLYRVATNLGFNALRAHKRRTQYEQAAAHESLTLATPTNPAAEVERQAEQAQVRHVLSLLKPRAAQLLLLRHSGFSYAEVAATLGVAPSSVGTLLARAEEDFEKQYRALYGEEQAAPPPPSGRTPERRE